MKIKVISLNLWHGGRLLPGILEFLQKEQPDILLCQEVYNGHDPKLEERHRSIDTLQKHFNFTAYDFAPAMLSKKLQIDQGNAVFAKFPIIASDVVFLSGEYREVNMIDPAQFPILPRVLQHAVIDTPAGQLNVFNMHGVWDLDGDNYSILRQEMSQKLLKATTGKSRVVLAGDSNAKHTNKAMRNLEKQLVSVFGNELKTTFNMRRKDNPGYATAAVDLMYISPDIKVLSKNCPKVDISDHFPLVVTLEV